MKKRRWKKMIALSLLFIFFSSNHIPAEPLPQDNPDETQEENEIENRRTKEFVRAVCMLNGCGFRAYFVWKRRGCASGKCQYDKDYDIDCNLRACRFK